MKDLVTLSLVAEGLQPQGLMAGYNVGGERWSRGGAPECQSRGWWFNPTYRRFDS